MEMIKRLAIMAIAVTMTLGAYAQQPCGSCAGKKDCPKTEQKCDKAHDKCCEKACEKCCEKACDKCCDKACDKCCDKCCEKAHDKCCEKACEKCCEKACDKCCDKACDKCCDKCCEKACDKCCEKACDKCCEKACEKACDAKGQKLVPDCKQADKAGCKKSDCDKAAKADCKQADCKQAAKADCKQAAKADRKKLESKKVDTKIVPLKKAGDKTFDTVTMDPGKDDSRKAPAATAKPMVIDYFATWCGPCRTLSPILEKIEAKYEGLVDFRRVDIDKNSEAVANDNIDAVPTLIFVFKDGHKERIEGLPGRDEATIEMVLDAAVQSMLE